MFDTDDIRKEYEVLLNELATFNPDMLDKQRILAITKSDMLDEELIQMLEEHLPKDVPHVFISSLTGMGISQLKDLLWVALNSESNKLAGIVRDDKLVHRSKDMSKLAQELREMGEDEELEFVEDWDDEEEDWDELEDFEYEEE